MKRFELWAKISAILMFVTALAHSLSLFVKPEPKNDAERQLIDLVNNYRMDAGAGFQPSFADLMTALSSCFSLLCLLGGAMLFQLIRKKAAPDMMSGVLNIYLVIFGICFAMMAYFTFLPPIVCSGAIFLTLIVSRLALKSVTN